LQEQKDEKRRLIRGGLVEDGRRDYPEPVIHAPGKNQVKEVLLFSSVENKFTLSVL
jgi:hypothetical protein